MSVGLPDGSLSGKSRNKPNPLLRPSCSLHLGKFNVRTLRQIGHQVALARTEGLFEIHILRFQTAHIKPRLRGHSL